MPCFPKPPCFSRRSGAAADSYACCIIETMRAAHLVRCVALAALTAIAGNVQGQVPIDELRKPLDWPVLVSKSAGIQFTLRTAWQDGALKYVATFSDEKGRIARYISKLKGGPVLSSFSFSFYDGDGFLLGTVHIPDSSLSRDGDAPSFRALGESQCTEKLYRAFLERWRAAMSADPSAPSTHAMSFPSELGESASPAKGK